MAGTAEVAVSGIALVAVFGGGVDFGVDCASRRKGFSRAKNPGFVVFLGGASATGFAVVEEGGGTLAGGAEVSIGGEGVTLITGSGGRFTTSTADAAVGRVFTDSNGGFVFGAGVGVASVAGGGGFTVLVLVIIGAK